FPEPIVQLSYARSAISPVGRIQVRLVHPERLDDWCPSELPKRQPDPYATFDQCAPDTVRPRFGEQSGNMGRWQHVLEQSRRRTLSVEGSELPLHRSTTRSRVES